MGYKNEEVTTAEAMRQIALGEGKALEIDSIFYVVDGFKVKKTGCSSLHLLLPGNPSIIALAPFRPGILRSRLSAGLAFFRFGTPDFLLCRSAEY